MRKTFLIFISLAAFAMPAFPQATPKVTIGADASAVLLQLLLENHKADFVSAKASCNFSLTSDLNRLQCDWTEANGSTNSIIIPLGDGQVSQENGNNLFSGGVAGKLFDMIKSARVRYDRQPNLKDFHGLLTGAASESWASIFSYADPKRPSFGCTSAIDLGSVCLFPNADQTALDKPFVNVPLANFASPIQYKEKDLAGVIKGGPEYDVPIYKMTTLSVDGKSHPLSLTGAGLLYQVGAQFNVNLGQFGSLPLAVNQATYVASHYMEKPIDATQPILPQVVASQYKVLQLTMATPISTAQIFLGMADTLRRNKISLLDPAIMKTLKAISFDMQPGDVVTFVGYGPADNQTLVVETPDPTRHFVVSGKNLVDNFWTMWFGASMLNPELEVLQQKLTGALPSDTVGR